MAVKVGSLYAEVFAKTAPFRRGMREVDDTLDATGKKFGAFDSNLSTIVGGAVFAGATLLIKNAVTAAAEAEDAQEALFTAMKQNGSFSNSTKNEILDYAKNLQDLTAIDDKLIIAEMAHGLQLGLRTSQIKDATKAALGLAEVNKISLKDAMEKVAQSAKGMSTNLEKMVEGFDKTADKSTYFDQVLRGTQKGFDAVVEKAKGTTGSIAKLSLAYNDLIVKLGTVFLPVVNLVTLALTKFVNVFEAIPVPVVAAVVAFAAVLVIISKWGAILKGLIAAWKALTTVIALAATAAGDVTVWARIATSLLIAAGTWYVFDKMMGTATDNTGKAKKDIDDLTNSLNDLTNAGKAFLGSSNKMKPGANLDKADDPLTQQALKLKELIAATHEAREAEMQRRRDLIGWKSSADLWKDTAVLGEQARFSARGFGKNELALGFNAQGGNQRIGAANDIGVSQKQMLEIMRRQLVLEEHQKMTLDTIKNFLAGQSNANLLVTQGF